MDETIRLLNKHYNFNTPGLDEGTVNYYCLVIIGMLMPEFQSSYIASVSLMDRRLIATYLLDKQFDKAMAIWVERIMLS